MGAGIDRILGFGFGRSLRTSARRPKFKPKATTPFFHDFLPKHNFRSHLSRAMFPWYALCRHPYHIIPYHTIPYHTILGILLVLKICWYPCVYWKLRPKLAYFGFGLVKTSASVDPWMGVTESKLAGCLSKNRFASHFLLNRLMDLKYFETILKIPTFQRTY